MPIDYNRPKGMTKTEAPEDNRTIGRITGRIINRITVRTIDKITDRIITVRMECYGP